MWFLIPVFLATAALAVIAGRRFRRRAPHPNELSEDTMLRVLEMIAQPERASDVIVGESMDIDGFTGRERVVCIRWDGSVFSVYATRKNRRFGFIMRDVKPPFQRYESPEYRRDTREGRLLASFFSPRLPVDPPAPSPKVPGTSEIPPEPPVDPFEPVPEPPPGPTAQA